MHEELESSAASTMAPPPAKVKAVVLLTEKQYLEENITDPRKYFPFMTRKKVLSQAECCSIKEKPSVEFQIHKFVELISLKERGYDVFVEALKSMKVKAHVAAYLGKRVSEVDKLYSLGQLPSEQQKLLTLHEFVNLTQLEHNYAEDILAAKDWDLKCALESARKLGHYCDCGKTETVCEETANAETLLQPSPSNEINCPCSAGGCDSDSIEGSSCLEGSLQCQAEVHQPEFHHVYGILPPSPPLSTGTGSPSWDDLCTPVEVNIEHGILPNLPVDHAPSLHPRAPSNSPPPRDSQLFVSENSLLQPRHHSPPPERPPKSAPVLPPKPVSSMPPRPQKPTGLACSSEHGKEPSPKQIGNTKKKVIRSPQTPTSRVPSIPVSLPLKPPAVQKPVVSPSRSLHATPSCSMQSTPPRGHAAGVGSGAELQNRASPMVTGVALAADAEPYQLEVGDVEAMRLMSSYRQPGIFFIRSCNKDGAPFSLCTNDGVKLSKYHIRSSPRGYHIDSLTCFPSISDLVEHYRRNPIGSAGGTKLTVLLKEKLNQKLLGRGELLPVVVNTTVSITPFNTAHTATNGCEAGFTNGYTSTGQPTVIDRPTMRLLQSMRDGNFQEIRTINETAYCWDLVAVAFDYELCTINTLRRDHSGCALRACYAMFSMWVDRRVNVTWEYLVDVLRRSEFEVLACRIESAWKIQDRY